MRMCFAAPVDYEESNDLKIQKFKILELFFSTIEKSAFS